MTRHNGCIKICSCMKHEKYDDIFANNRTKNKNLKKHTLNQTYA